MARPRGLPKAMVYYKSRLIIRVRSRYTLCALCCIMFFFFFLIYIVSPSIIVVSKSLFFRTLLLYILPSGFSIQMFSRIYGRNIFPAFETFLLTILRHVYDSDGGTLKHDVGNSTRNRYFYRWSKKSRYAS